MARPQLQVRNDALILVAEHQIWNGGLGTICYVRSERKYHACIRTATLMVGSTGTDKQIMHACHAA